MFLVNFLCNIGFLTAGINPDGQDCFFVFADEPECPKCLIK